MLPKLEKTWHHILQTEYKKPYFKDLCNTLTSAYQHTAVYPPIQNVFRALDLCPLPAAKVVILGQDPYHGPQQADGLAFSVPSEATIPPSLQNIFREIHEDTGAPIPNHGNLERWAYQGVLLLNTTLTVTAKAPTSHQHYGWEHFTNTIIETVSDTQPHVVFLLWGKHAQAKQDLIDPTRHLILSAPHPSPLSAYRGFFGCRHFSQANEFLRQSEHTPIMW